MYARSVIYFILHTPNTTSKAQIRLLFGLHASFHLNTSPIKTNGIEGSNCFHWSSNCCACYLQLLILQMCRYWDPITYQMYRDDLHNWLLFSHALQIPIKFLHTFLLHTASIQSRYDSRHTENQTETYAVTKVRPWFESVSKRNSANSSGVQNLRYFSKCGHSILPNLYACTQPVNCDRLYNHIAIYTWPLVSALDSLAPCLFCQDTIPGHVSAAPWSEYCIQSLPCVKNSNNHKLAQLLFHSSP